MTERKVVIVAGDGFFEAFRIIGPFDSWEAASAYADDSEMHPVVIIDLEPPIYVLTA